jgi:methionine synthase II (cobalamin-independent)
LPAAPSASRMAIAYAGGIHARSERYMRDHWAHAKGLLDRNALEASALREEREQAEAQQEAGLGLLAPALVRWEDLLRILCVEGSGVEAGPLRRTFETNTFHRQPVVSGLFPGLRGRLLGGFAIPAGRPWVLTLPSPWDFACRAQDAAGLGLAGLARAAGEALRPVVEEAVGLGAALVRFQDPSLAYPRSPRPDPDAVAASLRAAAGAHAGLCTLHLTNGDPWRHPEALAANPLGGLAVEQGPEGRAPPLPERTRLSVAAVRGEESLVEAPEEVARQASEVARACGLPLWGITHGWDLDHVPHAIARRKLSVLAQAARLAAEVTA